MSQRRRFYDALALLIDIEDYSALEYIEQQFDKRRGEILARCLCEQRVCVYPECKLPCRRVFTDALEETYRILE